MLQFNLHTVESAIVRRGTLRLTHKPNTIETPACLAYTIRGSVPHLVADNLKLLPVNGVHVALENFLEEKEPSSFKYPHGLHKYINMPDLLLFVDARDPLKQSPTSANTEKYMCVDTHGGVRRVTPAVWSEAMKAYRPDISGSPADIVLEQDAKAKRIMKSVNRTLRWLDEYLPTAKELSLPVFAPVVGSTNTEERIRSAKSTADRDVQGFVLNGFEIHEDCLKLMRTSIDHLPADKPRLAYGLSTPERILEGVMQGIDLFDGSYAYKTTERGKAITFKFGASDTAKRPKDKVPKTLNLWNPELAHVFEPIDPTCGCYSCSARHTQGYIHHLLNAHEMLAPLLLMSHNVYQLEQFMASIRKSIEEDRFEQDVTAFMEKYSHDKETDGEAGHEEEIDADSLGVPVKKKRTLLL